MTHREYVFERRLEKVPELLLCDKLEDGGPRGIASYIIKEFHISSGSVSLPWW